MAAEEPNTLPEFDVSSPIAPVIAAAASPSSQNLTVPTLPITTATPNPEAQHSSNSTTLPEVPSVGATPEPAATPEIHPSNDLCSICQYPPGTPNHRIATLIPCQHRFCLRCIKRWLAAPGERHGRCPGCRVNVCGLEYDDDQGQTRKVYRTISVDYDYMRVFIWTLEDVIWRAAQGDPSEVRELRRELIPPRGREEAEEYEGPGFWGEGWEEGEGGEARGPPSRAGSVASSGFTEGIIVSRAGSVASMDSAGRPLDRVPSSDGVSLASYGELQLRRELARRERSGAPGSLSPMPTAHRSESLQEDTENEDDDDDNSSSLLHPGNRLIRWINTPDTVPVTLVRAMSSVGRTGFITTGLTVVAGLWIVGNIRGPITCKIGILRFIALDITKPT